jgi:hypothetical protein
MNKILGAGFYRDTFYQEYVKKNENILFQASLTVILLAETVNNEALNSLREY